MAAIGHPIVGDGKYGGKGAFLTGAISRKLHLHSRRLRIDHPDGGAIDITAPVPEHFAASLDALGFDPLLGEVGLDDAPKGPPPKAAAKAAAKAHSKQIRKARRGERRGSGSRCVGTGARSSPRPRATGGPGGGSGSRCGGHGDGGGKIEIGAVKSDVLPAASRARTSNFETPLRRCVYEVVVVVVTSVNESEEYGAL